MANVTPLPDPNRPKEPAHPAAQVVARESSAALDRLLGQLDSLDVKASFLGTGTFALIAGFLAGIAAKPPTNPHLQDLAVFALFLDLLALVPVVFTWWPRAVDVPPHPRQLYMHHFNDQEVNVLMAIADQIAAKYDDTKSVANRKVIGIKCALILLVIATSVSAAAFGLDILVGASH